MRILQAWGCPVSDEGRLCLCLKVPSLPGAAGRLTDMRGRPYHYHADVKHMNSAGVLATLRDHQYYSSRVPESVLQGLPSD